MEYDDELLVEADDTESGEKLAAAERSRIFYWESHNLCDVPPYFFVV